MEHDYEQNGWIKFKYDPKLDNWLKSVSRAVFSEIHNNNNKKNWLRYQGTWFAGVRVLKNDNRGIVNNGPELDINSSRWALKQLKVKNVKWDPAQVSVCYPGYPMPREEESKAAFKYRLKRDAAHVDGLHPVGKEKIRKLKEQHAFIMGIPVTISSKKASPLVVWEGSHKIVKYYFEKEFFDIDPKDWKNIDITKSYHKAREVIFESCKRVEIHAVPGESYIIHRMALHGVAPWDGRANSGKEGRVIIYFRPEADLGTSGWLNKP